MLSRERAGRDYMRMRSGDWSKILIFTRINPDGFVSKPSNVKVSSSSKNPLIRYHAFVEQRPFCKYHTLPVQLNLYVQSGLRSDRIKRSTIMYKNFTHNASKSKDLVQR